MITTILFDIGGVVLKTEGLVSHIAKVFKQEDESAFWKLISYRCPPLCRGEISIFQFWKNIAKELEQNIPDNILSKLWIDDFKPDLVIDKKVVSIISSLKGKYKLATVSNVFKEHADICREVGIYDLFDYSFLSHELKTAKDDTKIFEIALKKLKSKPKETIFIDDIDKYLRSANSIGIHGILFKDATQLKKELSDLGVPIS